ncbi:MAG: ABC transporter ATP-binding protein, partial [Butyricicoccus sp.]|nr:ABC transporter ATP-binding protein [Butyricicoccus sp.]
VQLVVCFVTFFAMWRITRRGIPFYTRAQEAVDTVVRVIRENASGVRVIKALAGQDGERERFGTASRTARDAEIRAGMIMAATGPLTDFLLNTGLVWVILLGAVCVQRGWMGAGRIVAFLSYFTVIQNATIGLAKLFLKISKGIASANRIEEVLLAPRDQAVRESAAASDAALGMDGVTFSYLGVEPDLADATFALREGETLGILGPTGSGKTTLVSLLLRLYDADDGIVWVGGRDVTAQEKDALRSRFGVVFQNEALLAASIYENISFLRDIDRAAVERAAETAQIAAHIARLPAGFDTHVDIHGANFSGGQRQRLLIARALAARPRVLVLDSADSALDYQTAVALWAAIRRDHPETTLVIISERIASLRTADHILVLEDGRITAQGTHEELLRSSPRYMRMHELQIGGAVL